MRSALAVAFLVLLAPVAGASFLAAPVLAPVEAPRALTEVNGVSVYPAWPLLTADLVELAAAKKDIVRLHSAGKSASGLDLWLVEIADFENPAKVPLESRERLWIDGGTHANEHSGVMFVMHLLRFLANGYGENDTATWIVENRHTWIMPLVNPEGSLNGIGRLNNNLVNINRNYPVGWGDVSETPVLNNGGPYPASEAETRAVIAWWTKIQPDYMASIHCCGNLWFYPYGIEGRDPHVDDSPMLSRICDEAYAEVRDACGPIWSTIYPAGGSSVDTAYELTGAVSFGFEMSGREAALLWYSPATTSDIKEMESESWRGVLHAFLHIEKYGGRPALAVESVVPGAVVLRVTNEGWANLTRATVRVTDAAGQFVEAAVPRLAPGDGALVTLAGSFAAGSHDVRVAYAKRALGGEGVLPATLVVAEGAGGLVGAIGAAPPVAEADAGALGVPGPAGALVALALVGAALAGRRLRG